MYRVVGGFYDATSLLTYQVRMSGFRLLRQCHIISVQIQTWAVLLTHATIHALFLICVCMIAYHSTGRQYLQKPEQGQHFMRL